jgi:hypothetical protein
MMTAATSDAQGTTLPRYGFFPGVHPPRYRVAVITGELPSASPRGETNTRGWLEPDEYQTMQTNLASWAGHLLTDSWPQTYTPFIRNTDVAYAIVSDQADLTDSPWQKHCRALALVQLPSDAVLGDISDTLDYQRESSARAKHAGLTAVARLVDLLGLSRPTILRMGGVPSSTFYAWQKNPNSVIRTPTITRLLQLQAQAAILDEALGRERMRDWVLSANRLEKLQGDDAAFAQVLEEANAALADATRILPRQRMRHADYASGLGGTAEVAGLDSLPWPGASKLDEEETR